MTIPLPHVTGLRLVYTTEGRTAIGNAPSNRSIAASQGALGVYPKAFSSEPSQPQARPTTISTPYLNNLTLQPVAPSIRKLVHYRDLIQQRIQEQQNPGASAEFGAKTSETVRRFEDALSQAGEIYRSNEGRGATVSSPPHRCDESPTGYSSAGYSPPEPASGSPAGEHSEGGERGMSSLGTRLGKEPKLDASAATRTTRRFEIGKKGQTGPHVTVKSPGSQAYTSMLPENRPTNSAEEAPTLLWTRAVAVYHRQRLSSPEALCQRAFPPRLG
jgi:hypothetical protein